MRTVDERIGQTDDTCAPPRVRARIVNRDHSCHLCGQPIQVDQNWDLDHVKALINGGEDRESNLRPSHRKCHVAKTALDVAERAKVSAVRKKHLAIAFPKRSIKSQGFAKRFEARLPEPPSSSTRPALRADRGDEIDESMQPQSARRSPSRYGDMERRVRLLTNSRLDTTLLFLCFRAWITANGFPHI